MSAWLFAVEHRQRAGQVRLAVAAALPRAAPAKCKEAIAIAARLVACDDEVEVRLRALASIEELCAEGRSRSRSALLHMDPKKLRYSGDNGIW